MGGVVAGEREEKWRMGRESEEPGALVRFSAERRRRMVQMWMALQVEERKWC